MAETIAQRSRQYLFICEFVPLQDRALWVSRYGGRRIDAAAVSPASCRALFGLALRQEQFPANVRRTVSVARKTLSDSSGTLSLCTSPRDAVRSAPRTSLRTLPLTGD